MTDYLYRLDVPAGKRSFTVAEVLEATCLAIHPDILCDEQPVMILSFSKAKISPCSPGLMGPPEALKDEDKKTLDAAWSGLSEPEFPMTAAQWQTYRDAFNSSHDKPESWILSALQRDPKYQRELAREVAAMDHRATLKRAVNAGAITLRNPVTGLVSELGWIGNADKWLLTRKQFMAFCDLLSIELLDAPSPSAAVTIAPERPMPVAREWQVIARDYAGRYIAEQAKRELYPNQEAVAADVAGRLKKESVTGPTGLPLTASYIKRHALKGMQSGAEKLRSTGRHRGK